MSNKICSFCNLSTERVVAGLHGASICSKCVDRCQTLLHKNPGNNPNNNLNNENTQTQVPKTFKELLHELIQIFQKTPLNQEESKIYEDFLSKCNNIFAPYITTTNTNDKQKSKDIPNIDKAVPVVTKKDEKTLDELLQELNNLTGLQVVKDEVNTIINQIKIKKVREKKGLSQVETSNHLVFVGNPGTGKTTVARLLGDIYNRLGLLSKGQLIEVDKSDLVAGYTGQTAIKTQKVIQEADGGILFIDEAYSLVTEGTGGFGQEAIDTLLKAMEDNRDDFIVIVAGYPNLMNDFLKSNPGLQSRFNSFIHFEDYDAEQLYDIFVGICKKHKYIIEHSALEHLKQHFANLYKNKGENYANARDVRNFFEKILKRQANRLASYNDLTDDDLLTLKKEDLFGENIPEQKLDIENAKEDGAKTELWLFTEKLQKPLVQIAERYNLLYCSEIWEASVSGGWYCIAFKKQGWEQSYIRFQVCKNRQLNKLLYGLVAKSKSEISETMLNGMIAAGFKRFKDKQNNNTFYLSKDIDDWNENSFAELSKQNNEILKSFENRIKNLLEILNKTGA